jgi:hypothetical protein
LAQQVDQVPPVTASGIEHSHARCNIPAQNLVEDIDIDLPELLLYAQGQRDTFSKIEIGKLRTTRRYGATPIEPLSDFTVVSFER